MKNLTIKHLRYFEALARYQHFGRAADACAISQPALSLQIKDLERILGAPLIERSARRIHPTTFGLEFLDRARHIECAVVHASASVAEQIGLDRCLPVDELRKVLCGCATDGLQGKDAEGLLNLDTNLLNTCMG